MKSTAEKIAKIFVVSADLPDFENYISIEKVEKVCSSAKHVRAFVYVCMYVCLWKYMFVYVLQQDMYLWQQKVIVMYEGFSVPYIH